MERLTEYESIGGYAHAILTGDLDKAIMRLAAYEDVGLEPAELISMQGEWCTMMAALNSIGGGYGRLLELAEADKDGRVVVRCKDCKWFIENSNDKWWGCWLYHTIKVVPEDAPKPNDFCSYGERKEESHDRL